MKGPNPFVPWEEDQESIYGRKEETRIFNSFVNAVSSKQGSGLLIIGGPGVGKTSLMRHFRHQAEKNGLLAPYVKVEKGEDGEAVAGKISHELSLLPGFKGKAAPKTFRGLVDRAEKAGRFGAVFFIDDIDRMRRAEEALSEIVRTLKSGWNSKKAGFVMGSTKEFKVPSEMVGIMRLKPLDEHDARELITKALKKGPPKMGEECLHSIMAGSGGNPKILKSICRNIYGRLRDEEKVISKGHYLAYLPHTMSMLSREWFGRMYQETPEAERKILRILAKNEEGMHVSDIAKDLGRPLGPVTALTRRLLDRGQIVRLDRGKYRIFARLYAKYIIQRG